MKKSYLFIVVLVFVFATINSCGKNIEEVNTDFIGYWQGSDETKAYTIRIKEDGQGRYSYVGDGAMGNSEGRVRYRKGKLKIGALIGLEVNEMPSFNEGFWIMKVENVEYVRNN